MALNNDIKSIARNYKTTYQLDTNLKITSITDTVILKDSTATTVYDFKNTKNNNIKVTMPSGEIKEIATDVNSSGEVFLVGLGNYSIEYTGETRAHFVGSTSRYSKYSFKFLISVVENKLPLKKWTVTDVVNRLLDLAEPIRKGEVPRFRFNQEQAAQFDKVLSPQFSFTKQTLRECLQEVGRFLHGEARLTPKKDLFMDTRNFASGICYLGGNPAPYSQAGQYFVIIDNQKFQLKLDSEADGGSDDWYLEIIDSDYTGSLLVYDATKTGWYFEVSFELYARQDQAGIYTRPYIKETVSQVIDSYTSYLDSSAENLVNQLDKYSGVITEPRYIALATSQFNERGNPLLSLRVRFGRTAPYRKII